MSMYSNKFVLCVLVNGQPLQELANGVVTLPFGTEYALRFRNKNNRRAVVKIYIDGENVSGDGYVIRANDHVDIKRHHDVDRSFKFVSLDSPDAIDHGKNGPNEDKTKGTIEARFYFEKEAPPRPVVVDHHHHHHHHDWYRPIVPRPMPYPYNGPWISYSSSASSKKATLRGIGGSSAGGSVNYGCTMDSSPTMGCAPSTFESAPSTLGFCESSNKVLKDGCTVEGNYTGQNFHTVYIDLEETYTSLKLFLQGHEQEVQAAIAPKKTRKTNKDNRIDDLEAENEELRRKLAELENEQLKSKLAAAQKPVAGGKTKTKPKAKPKKDQVFDFDGKRISD